jgi:hypothetical protein
VLEHWGRQWRSVERKRLNVKSDDVGNQKSPLRVLRYPIALGVGYGAGRVSHELLGLTSVIAWIVSALMFVAVLILLRRVVYSGVGW